MKINYIFDEGSSKEDAYIMKDNIFGVFDGFNSLCGYRDSVGRSGGLIAAQIVRDVFLQNDKSLKDLAVEANKKIREKLIEVDINLSDKLNLWGVASAVIRLKDKNFEWLQLTDSLILIIYNDNTFKLLVDNYDCDKHVLNLWKNFAQKKEKNIKALIDEKILPAHRNQMNRSYGAFTGEPEALSFIKTGEEGLNNIKHILLFTDGIFLPKEDPNKEDDWNLFVKLFLEGGLKRVKDYVRNIEKDDPYCWKYPRFKQHDDITAISISF